MWNPLLCTIRGRPYIQSGTQLQGTLPLLTNAGHKERELLWSKNIFFKLITTSMNHLYLLFVDLFAANLIAWFQVTLEQSFKGSFWLIFTLFSIVRYVIDFSWHRSNFFNLINLWHGTTAVITHQHNSGGEGQWRAINCTWSSASTWHKFCQSIFRQNVGQVLQSIH